MKIQPDYYSRTRVKDMLSTIKMLHVLFISEWVELSQLQRWPNINNAEIFWYKPRRPKGFFQIEIIIHVLVRSSHLF